MFGFPKKHFCVIYVSLPEIVNFYGLYKPIIEMNSMDHGDINTYPMSVRVMNRDKIWSKTKLALRF